jgi:flagellar export protein FliJ
MAKWAHSLIRLSTYEVETLQKRLAEVASRRVSAEMRAATLDAELEVERERAREDVSAGLWWAAYVGGWKARKAAADSALASLEQEEAGARDALTRAYEELKKFEHVADKAKAAATAAAAKRENAAYDEAALRRAAG